MLSTGPVLSSQRNQRWREKGKGGATHRSSEPAGTNTPSASRYARNAGSSGRTIVLAMLSRAKSGYHAENWNARMYALDSGGNAIPRRLDSGSERRSRGGVGSHGPVSAPYVQINRPGAGAPISVRNKCETH